MNKNILTNYGTLTIEGDLRIGDTIASSWRTPLARSEWKASWSSGRKINKPKKLQAWVAKLDTPARRKNIVEFGSEENVVEGNLRIGDKNAATGEDYDEKTFSRARAARRGWAVIFGWGMILRGEAEWYTDDTDSTDLH